MDIELEHPDHGIISLSGIPEGATNDQITSIVNSMGFQRHLKQLDTNKKVSFKKGMEDMVARGIRNNNPGNIEHGEDWEGLSSEQPDQRFAKFESPEMGIRAMTKIMQTYKNKHGINTVAGVINRWAPPHENDSEAYAKYVAGRMGVEVDDEVDLSNPETLRPLIQAMTFMENGENPYEDKIVAEGIRLAGLSFSQGQEELSGGAGQDELTAANNILDKLMEDRFGSVDERRDMAREILNFILPIGEVSEGGEFILPDVAEAGLMGVIAGTVSKKGKRIQDIFKVSRRGEFNVIGQVSDHTDNLVGRVDTVLTPSVYSKLASPLNVQASGSVEFLKKAIKQGDPIAPPYLSLTWNKDKRAWDVTGHEGRHRMLAASEEFGEDVLVPSNLFLKTSNGRRIEFDKLDSVQLEALKKGNIIPEAGVGRSPRGRQELKTDVVLDQRILKAEKLAERWERVRDTGDLSTKDLKKELDELGFEVDFKSQGRTRTDSHIIKAFDKETGKMVEIGL